MKTKTKSDITIYLKLGEIKDDIKGFIKGCRCA